MKDNRYYIVFFTQTRKEGYAGLPHRLLLDDPFTGFAQAGHLVDEALAELEQASEIVCNITGGTTPSNTQCSV